MEVDKPKNDINSEIEFSVEFKILSRMCFNDIGSYSTYLEFINHLKTIVSKNKFLQEHCSDDEKNIKKHKKKLCLYIKELALESTNSYI